MATEHAGQATAAAEQSRVLLAQAAAEINRLEAENQCLQQQVIKVINQINIVNVMTFYNLLENIATLLCSLGAFINDVLLDISNSQSPYSFNTSGIKLNVSSFEINCTDLLLLTHLFRRENTITPSSNH